MNNVLIETLTPLHVGSGRILQSNTEYLYFDSSREISVIDETKILSIIGEENIDIWVNVIEKNQNLLDYLRNRSPNLTPQETHRRIMRLRGNSNPAQGKNGIREHLFSGNGQALLAGSSLKGAIRTAFFNHVVFSNKVKAKNFRNLQNQNGKFKGVKIEKEYLGSDPNKDIFRLLRVGDFSFQQTECVLAETLNQRYDTFEMKEQVKQHIECIPARQFSIGRIQVPESLLKQIQKRASVWHSMTNLEHLTDLSKLFSYINSHSLRLVKNEIRKYEKVHLPEKADSFVEELNKLVDQIENVKPNECIIRVGFGSGYLGMTGGWPLEVWKNDMNIDYVQKIKDLGTEVRRNNRYNDYDLPKSRKMTLGGIPLGFIKMSLLDSDASDRWTTYLLDERRKAEEQEQLQQQKSVELAEQHAKALEEQKELERLQAEEARKPKMYEGNLKKNATIIDAEVISITGNKVKLKLFASNQENNFKEITHATLKVGMIVQVLVKMVAGNGKIVAIEFKNIK